MANVIGVKPFNKTFNNSISKNKLKAVIQSISNVGVAVIKFSTDIFVPTNISCINDTVLDIKIAPGL